MRHKVMARGWLVGLPGGCDVIHNMQNNSNKNKPETRAGGRGSKSPLSGRGRSGPHDGRVQIARGADSKKSLNRLKKKVYSRRLFSQGKKPGYYSGYFFLLFQPHSEWSTFLTKFLFSLRSSIFKSSKKLNRAKGYSLRVFLALTFSKKIHQTLPPSIF